LRKKLNKKAKHLNGRQWIGASVKGQSKGANSGFHPSVLTRPHPSSPVLTRPHHVLGSLLLAHRTPHSSPIENAVPQSDGGGGGGGGGRGTILGGNSSAINEPLPVYWMRLITGEISLITQGGGGGGGGGGDGGGGRGEGVWKGNGGGGGGGGGWLMGGGRRSGKERISRYRAFSVGGILQSSVR
jgi:hypothetical protein